MKLFFIELSQEMGLSPPSRGAWIEIESDFDDDDALFGRPPRGGRGLKSCVDLCIAQSVRVAPLAGGVD